jgi:hypothetical protein
MDFTGLSDALEGVFRDDAREVFAEHGVIQRRRKLDAVTLASTLVMSLMGNPRAGDHELVDTAARLGVTITRQALRQRMTVALAQALKGLFERCVRRVVGGSHSQVLAPILARFDGVDIFDSTTISLPPSLRDTFPGCGGKQVDAGAAAFKLQTVLDLRDGTLPHIQIEAGKSPDVSTTLQFAPARPGQLRIADLGYFRLDALQAWAAPGGLFLSRVQIDTKLSLPDGTPVDLAWLKQQLPGLVEVSIEMGVEHRLPCRLIAFRVPEEQAGRRKQKRRELSLRKRKREPHPEALEWCEWTLLVTNAPQESLSATEAIVLYRARWQIELLFKRWKSIAAVDLLDGRDDTETMIRLWARLIGAVLQHWLTVGAVWFHGANHSLYRVARRVRTIVPDLTRAILEPWRFVETLQLFLRLTLHCRHDPRAKPSTFELLNHPEKLDFRLT